jgi:DNA polymerase-1
MRTLLIDGDILSYQCAIFNEVATEIEPGYWVWHCEFGKVIDSINWQISTYMKRLEADNFILCLTDNDKNFRKDILSTYKGNRSNLKRPLVLKPTREYLIKELDARITPGLEGDDLMGILSTEETDDERIIVSIDKDLKTINGKYYNPNADVVVEITEEEADWWHLYQTLTGDTIDGYSGCPSIGAVTAKKILDESPTWDAVIKTYKKKGLTEEDALVQARVARILRSSDIDNEGNPILWTPKEDNNKKETS